MNSRPLFKLRSNLIFHEKIMANWKMEVEFLVLLTEICCESRRLLITSHGKIKRELKIIFWCNLMRFKNRKSFSIEQLSEWSVYNYWVQNLLCLITLRSHDSINSSSIYISFLSRCQHEISIKSPHRSWKASDDRKIDRNLLFDGIFEFNDRLCCWNTWNIT